MDVKDVLENNEDLSMLLMINDNDQALSEIKFYATKSTKIEDSKAD